MHAPVSLTTVPVVDVRDGGPPRHAREARERARALRDDCVAWLPRAAHPALPLLDGVTRRWLSRSASPYVPEVATIAADLNFPGIWFLNGSYQWGCTARGCEEEGVPWLVRTLDWPFSGLGRHVELARMAGPAGEYWSVTWAGFVGVLTGMAPGRFAACLNQAPLWRRTRHAWLRVYDIALNAAATWSVRHIPPDQLLRQAFETCGSFAEARRHLETMPIARPAIYTLVGCRPGERCVIERTEDACASRDEPVSAANDWLEPREPWEARIGGDLILTCSYAEAAERSHARRAAIAGWSGSLARDPFGWVVPPVLNKFTRLAVEMSPVLGTLRVTGYEYAADLGNAHPVTLPCAITAAPAA
jgi:hypothetical protein